MNWTWAEGNGLSNQMKIKLGGKSQALTLGWKLICCRFAADGPDSKAKMKSLDFVLSLVAASCCLAFGCVGLLQLLILCFSWLQPLVAWDLVVLASCSACLSFGWSAMLLVLLCVVGQLWLAFGFMLMLGLCFNFVHGFNLLSALVSALGWPLVGEVVEGEEEEGIASEDGNVDTKEGVGGGEAAAGEEAEP
ncbi:uncharacterized protein A4U43_C07F8750 [Asparagus officinalis]|uniref:Transmembrane protein n=1 Tax=Asparagus officinalis TaxID=4686 RepID=A0A5P1EAG3_ASPOF|nr:uncharacterized protein A4U43_C07F8750 [Asparagus officinalis]